jgi:hypothetical protein
VMLLMSSQTTAGSATNWLKASAMRLRSKR